MERFPPHILFAVVASLQFLGVLWAAQASGKMLIVALAVAMAAIYAQVTVNDLVIARYTADAWRSRVFAVRYFLTFVVSGAAVRWQVCGSGVAVQLPEAFTPPDKSRCIEVTNFWLSAKNFWLSFVIVSTRRAIQS